MGGYHREGQKALEWNRLYVWFMEEMKHIYRQSLLCITWSHAPEYTALYLVKWHKFSVFHTWSTIPIKDMSHEQWLEKSIILEATSDSGSSQVMWPYLVLDRGVICLGLQYSHRLRHLWLLLLTFQQWVAAYFGKFALQPCNTFKDWVLIFVFKIAKQISSSYSVENHTGANRG